ncbi:MAG: hypothetical protein R3E87_19145 [Burkholderiaceae bacterium]
MGLVFLLVSGASMSAAEPQAVTLRYRLFDGPDANLLSAVFVAWTHELEARSNGRLRFVPARDETPLRPPTTPGNSRSPPPVADQQGLLQRLGDGRADLVWMRPTDMAGAFPRLSVFELPMLVKDTRAASRALWEFMHVYAIDEFKDVRVVGMHVQAPAQLHLVQSPSPSPDALCVRPIDTDSSAVLEGLFKALDCPPPVQKPAPDASSTEPSVIPPQAFAQSYTKLASSFEGADAAAVPPMTHLESASDQAVLSTRVYMLAMSPAAYEALPADLRGLLDDSLSAGTSLWFAAAVQALERQARDGFERQTSRQFSLEEYDRLRAAAAKVQNAWLAGVKARGFDGQQLLDGARTLIKQHTR